MMKPVDRLVYRFHLWLAVFVEIIWFYKQHSLIFRMQMEQINHQKRKVDHHEE